MKASTMHQWMKWPKVCKGRSGAANTKRYRWVLIMGRNGGSGPLIPMGSKVYAGHARAWLKSINLDHVPMRATERGASAGVAHVGYTLHADGLARVYQRFVLGARTGTPRFYGGRWS